MKTYCGEVSWTIVKYCREAWRNFCEVLMCTNTVEENYEELLWRIVVYYYCRELL